MKYNRANILAVFLLILTACEDDHDHDHSDTSFPVFTMTSPADNQVYQNGDTIWIKGLLTDNELHELKIKIVKNGDTSALFSDIISVHELSSYTINRFWKSSVSDTTAATLVLSAEDHQPNITEKKIPVTILK